MPTLRWLTRDEDLKLASKSAYRMLNEVPELGAGDKSAGNMIIQGDNLEALKALLPFYAGQVKCIYIDPPYNTGSAFEHYDDNLEHSIWLSMIYPRLELLRELLAENGLIFIQLDDNEGAYFKVLMDEIFGRQNYLNTLTVKAKVSAGASGGGEDKKIKKNTEFLYVYSKDKNLVDYAQFYNRTPIEKHIREHEEDEIGFYYTRVLKTFGEKKLIYEIGGMKIYEHKHFEFTNISNLMKEENLSQKEVFSKYFDKIFMVTNAQTSLLTKVNEVVREKNKLISYEYMPNTGRYKGSISTRYVWNETLIVWFADSAEKDKKGVYKKEQLGTLWDDISWGRLDLEGGGGVKFKNGKKPEAIVERILKMATHHGDLVLDSFLGSGTTAAVAHKMGRRYIGIEMGEHAKTHCVARLRKVIEGEQGGISKSIGWTGGGGFRFYTLGETIFEEDGQIRKGITFEQLAAHIWFCETKTPFNKRKTKSAFLGIYNNVAYALLYNGILHDRSIDGGNILTSKTLEIIYKDIKKTLCDHTPTICVKDANRHPSTRGELKSTYYKELIIYGEASRIGHAKLKSSGIEFKQIPYEVRAR